MVDNPDRLLRICLNKITNLLKSDQFKWKNYIEDIVDKYEFKENIQINKRFNGKLFIGYFLREHFKLNSNLSESLVYYLVENDCLNDFTLSIFSSNITCLKKLVVNIKYLTHLQIYLLSQHENLNDLEIIFYDSLSNRTREIVNKSFYQHICPSLNSDIHEILTIYSPFILYNKALHLPNHSKKSFDNILLKNLSNSINKFSPEKLLNSILNNLHPVIFQRLKSLNLSDYKFFTLPSSSAIQQYSSIDMFPLINRTSDSITTTTDNGIPENFSLLLKFQNLTSLNLSSTDIKNPYFNILIDNLQNLNKLDVSSCRSIDNYNSLLKLSSKLKWLNLYNCCFQMQHNSNIYNVLYELKYLEYLDISNDNTYNDNKNSKVDNNNDINKFLSDNNCLPHLKYFDISGLKTIASESLEKFIINHRNLTFLGLFLTNEKYTRGLFDENDACYSKTRQYTNDLSHMSSVALTDNDFILYEPYLMEALKRYDDRFNFVQKILYYFFHLTRTFRSKHTNFLVDRITQVMIKYSNVQSIQLASTACLYNLTRTPFIEQIHVKCLRKVVEAIINVMVTFPSHHQLQKNCLLTLCSDRILYEANFNFYLLATLVLRNLQTFSELAVIQPAVAILSLLTTRLNIDECSRLGTSSNLMRMLQIVEQQIDHLQTVQMNQTEQNRTVQNENFHQTSNDADVVLKNAQQLTSDDTLRFSLSLLWNLTDENLIVCKNFIQSNGLNMFQRILHLFSSDTMVLTKIFGLASNLAEISCLKSHLRSINMISIMKKYIAEPIIDVAFSAIGVLVHLICEQTDNEIDYDLCEKMKMAIISWQSPHTNMVTYRSFKPLIPLLSCDRIPVVQLWAIWTIHHVCSTDRLRYNRIINDEKIYEIIQYLYHNELSCDHPDIFVIRLLKATIQVLQSYNISFIAESRNRT